ncbi:MAG: glycine--tRNA ligase [Patescibacteria group bacterium]
MEAIVSLAKRRGFVHPSAELYGGLGGFYDFGPLGVQLKRNLEALWWKVFVEERDDVYGIESSIIAPPAVFAASGHLAHFTDPMVECKVCNERIRADKEDDIKEHKHQDFTEVKQFNTMFKTFAGPVEEDANVAYLRPETAQGMFTNYMNVMDSMRAKVPFGIAQIGKSFRNEITYRNFIFRVREFDIAELEYFVKPGEDEKAFDDWLVFMENALIERFGLKKENLKRYETPKDELAHYSKRTVDIHYKFPWGWDELWGLANRTDYDLKRHMEASGKNFMYRDPKTNEEYLPYVIEPTGGIGRLFLAVMLESYRMIEGGRTKTTEATKDEELVLQFPKHLAPIQIAILPLSKKEELAGPAKELQTKLQKHWTTSYDETASIGRRYRRQDEAGTPYCVTVDFDTLTDSQVTVRDRDTMEQERIPIDDLIHYFTEKFS